MLAALALSIGQLGDPRVLRLLLRSVAVSLLLLGLLVALVWWGIDVELLAAGLADTRIPGAGLLRGTLALVAALIGGWLAWRIVAFAVLQFYADRVVDAVEARHYPTAHVAAQAVDPTSRWRTRLLRGWRGGVKSGARAVAWNVAALPFELALLVTGVGMPILFWAVNAALIGRELTDMVWLRQGSGPPPISRAERWGLGGTVAGLMLVPGVNLLAPFLGAAMAAHLIHRKGPADAR